MFGFFEGDDEKQSSKFTEACWLMDYMDLIASYGKTKNQLGFTNFKIIDSDPSTGAGAYQIISKLTSREGIRVFLDSKPAVMANLVPKIRLYKLVYGSEDTSNPVASPEFIFDDYYSKKNIDDLFGIDSFKRVGGAGISEVNWKLNGKNPAEADKVIEVTMKFEFQTVSDLLGDRCDYNGSVLAGNPDSDMKANFIDLILHPPGFNESQGYNARQTKEKGEYVPKFYRIRLDIGWGLPEIKEGIIPTLTQDETSNLIRELQKQEMSIFLNLVSHSFDIKENGKISLTVEYIGALEESINGNDANILALIDRKEKTRETQKDDVESKRQRISEMNEYIECLRLNNPDDEEIEKYSDNIEDIQEDIADGEEELDEALANDKSEVYKQFLSYINKEVQTIEVEEEEIEEWLKTLNSKKIRPKMEGLDKYLTGEAPSTESVGVSNEGEAMEAIESVAGTGFFESSSDSQVQDVVKEANEAQQDAEKGYIQFLFLGDIINAACTLMNPSLNKSIGESAIILGPVVLNHPRGNKYQINLADLPISYSDFQAFFFETVVRKQIASYPLKQFLKDILERLVKKTLQPSECFEVGKEKRAINISMTNFAIKKSTADQNSIRTDFKMKTGRLNVANIVNNSSQPYEGEPMVNCLFFYMNSYKASELVANEEKDREIGIYHFYLGADRGIVKSIDYTRTDVQGLREARQAEARNLGQIRDVYNASVKLFGNSLFYPGMKVFLNPPMGFGRPEIDGSGGGQTFGTVANLLGIGGYYDVISVESTISRGGQYETSLECIFAQSGGKLESIEAKCEGILQNPPERDDTLVESVTDAVSSVISSVFGGNE